MAEWSDYTDIDIVALGIDCRFPPTLFYLPIDHTRCLAYFSPFFIHPSIPSPSSVTITSPTLFKTHDARFTALAH